MNYMRHNKNKKHKSEIKFNKNQKLHPDILDKPIWPSLEKEDKLIKKNVISKNINNLEIWENCKNHLSNQIAPSIFQSIIIPLQTIIKIQNNLIDIELIAPNTLILNRLKLRCLNLIKEYYKNYNPIVQVQLSLNESRTIKIKEINKIDYDKNKKNIPIPFTENSELSNTNIKSKNFKINNQQKDKTQSYEINISDSFYLNDYNKKHIERLWDGSNSLHFICGESGCGKSTLAINLKDSKNKNGEKVHFIKFQTFLSEFALVSQKKNSASWRERYKNYDYLILDDFHYIKATATKTQEELLYIIDEYKLKNKKLIIISEHPPAKLKLTPALHSRIQAAHFFVLKSPNQNQREQILKKELAKVNIDLKIEYVSYLCQMIHKDIRLLKSVSNRIQDMYSYIQNNSKKNLATKVIDFATIDQYCKDLYTKKEIPNSIQILKKVAEYYQLTTESITGPSRIKKFSIARHLVAYICNKHLKYTLHETAKVIGRKDHASVIHACKKIEKIIENDLFFRQQALDLISQI